MKQILFIVLGLVIFSSCKKQLPTVVAGQVMSQMYEEVKTPYKYSLIVAPDSNSYKLDCPTIFRKDDKWIMTNFEASVRIEM